MATSRVHGVDIVFDRLKLREILKISSIELVEYV